MGSGDWVEVRVVVKVSGLRGPWWLRGANLSALAIYAAGRKVQDSSLIKAIWVCRVEINNPCSLCSLSLRDGPVRVNLENCGPEGLPPMFYKVPYQVSMCLFSFFDIVFVLGHSC